MIEHIIEQRPPETSEQDLRSQTTVKIWGMAAAMLGICIPLSAVTHTGGLIPIAVLCAAAIGTGAVWLRGGIAAPSRLKIDEAATQKRVQELEERLANLEAITNFEHKLLDFKYPPEQKPVTSLQPVKARENAS